jgi:lipopolysaccharide transport system ATP-binding protein
MEGAVSSVLAVQSVSKRFRTYRDRPATLKESLVRRLSGSHVPSQFHWALQDVTFAVEEGRALGIIGHNGAGKSTLLRLMCGLGRPTRGAIASNGRVSGLLDLGSGFHPDMTGRENIMTGGMLSGLTAGEVRAQEEEIIAFAELEQFIDQPIRTYSSGMYLRLAFATAMQFDPAVLVIDEVLAVGDTRFQQKCLRCLASFRSAGKTLILTSHWVDQIRALCDEVLVLEEGRVVMQGAPERAIACYDDLMRQRTEQRAAQILTPLNPIAALAGQGARQGTQEATITEVSFRDTGERPISELESGDSLIVDFEYRLARPLQDLAFILGIYNDANVKCFETTIPSLRDALGQIEETGRFRCYLPQMPLMAGHYAVNVGLYPLDWSYLYDYHWKMHTFDITSRHQHAFEAYGIVALQPTWTVPMALDR